MKRITRVKVWGLAALLLCCMLQPMAMVMAEDDPISASMEITPHALAGPVMVRVGITVTNMDEKTAWVVTLQDPHGNNCPGFGENGTATLQPGQSQRYDTYYDVTEQQLRAGRVVYSLRYSIVDEQGAEVGVLRPVAALLEFVGPPDEGGLLVEQSQSGHRAVALGETVEFRYRLTNIGDEVITHIQINDSITDYAPSHAPLFPGDSAEIAYRHEVRNTVSFSEPWLTYHIKGREWPITEKLDVTRLIAEPGLTISIAASEDVVYPDDTITMEYTIINGTDKTYTDMYVADATLGNVDSGFLLEPGVTHKGFLTLTINESTTFCFVTRAVDEAGNEMIISSNECTVRIADGK